MFVALLGVYFMKNVMIVAQLAVFGIVIEKI